ncbi:MAG: hypothetical protein ACI8UX_002221 [Psychromonas sp.]|jgi:hypothetical protein
MNENKRIPNGNLIWIKDKNWGMREFHSNIWKINVGEGRGKPFMWYPVILRQLLKIWIT